MIKQLTPLLFLALLTIQTSFAADRYWVSSTNATWNNNLNWSTSSGGVGGASIPGQSDQAIFDANGLGDATLSANLSLSGLIIHVAYTGAIELSGFTLNISGTSQVSFVGGTINNGALIIQSSSIVLFNGTIFNTSVSSVSARLILNGSTFNRAVNLEKTGAISDFSAGGNVFNDTTVISMSSIGGALHLSDGAPGNTGVDTFRTEVTFNNTGTGLLSVAEKRDQNFFGGNITLNSSGGRIAFGLGGGSSTLAVGKTIQVGSGGFSGGILLLGGMKILDPNPWNITFTGNAGLHLGGRTIFHGEVNSTTPGLCLNGATYLKKATLEKTGPGIDFCTGGSVFNDTTVITMSSIGGAIHMSDGAPGATGVDTFHTEVTFNNTGTGLLSVAEKRDQNFFGGNITLNSSGGRIAFGLGGGSSTLAVGKTIQVGDGGFSGGILLLGGMKMLDADPWNIAFTGTARLHFNAGSIFHGEVNSITPGLCLNGATFLKRANLEKTGPSLNFCAGGNTFNDTTVITMSSIGGAIHLSDGAPGNTGVDTFRTEVTFNNTGTGLLSVAEQRAQNFFGGNVVINGTGGMTFFGLGGGTALVTGDITANRIGSGRIHLLGIVLNGTATQTIGGIASLPPLFSNLEINNGLGVTLNTAIDISISLQLTAGTLVSDSVNLVTLKDNTVVTGASPSSFVAGPIRKIGNDAFTFPTGKGSNHQPISISPPSSITHAFTAEYIDIAHPFGSALDTGLGRVSSCEYWQLDRTTGTSTVEVTIGWNANSCDVTQPSDRRVTRWDGAKWTNLGNGGTTGDPSSGTVSSAGPVSDFGAFALGSATAAIPTVDDIDLGAAAGFALLSGDSIISASTIITAGNVGSILNVSDSIVSTDSVFTANDTEIQLAISELTTTMELIKDIPGTSISSSLDGLTLPGGVYEISGNANLSTTLNLSGDQASIYVFKIADTLFVDSGATLVLGSVLPNNVYWVTLNSHVQIGQNVTFSGVVLTKGNINSNTGNLGRLALLTSSGRINISNGSIQDKVFLYSQVNMLFSNGSGFIITKTPDVPVCGDTVTFSTEVILGKKESIVLLNVDLPFGVEYVPGSEASSLYTIVENTSNFNLNQPGFRLFKPGNCGLLQTCPFGPDTISITYDVVANCNAITADSVFHVTSGTFSFGIDTVGDTSQLFSILSPILSISQSNIIPNPLVGNVKDTLCRSINITNSGDVALLKGFTIVENYGPSIEVLSISPGISTINTVNNTVTIFIPDSLLPVGGLAQDSSFTLTECIAILSCTHIQDSIQDGGESTFQYYWQCGSDTCQINSVNANVLVPNTNVATIRILSDFTAPDFCYGTDNLGEAEIIIENLGAGPAFDVVFTLNSSLNTYMAMDTSGFDFISALGDTILNIQPDTMFITDTSDFCRESVVSYIQFTLPDLPGNASHRLRFNTITCCIDTADSNITCNQSFLKFFSSEILYKQQCDTDSVYLGIQDIFKDRSFYEMQYAEGPSDMDDERDSTLYDGDTALFSFENTFIDLWNGGDTQMIQAVFNFNGGLCYIDTLFNSLALNSGDTAYWMPETVVVDQDPLSCAGTVTAWFILGDADTNFVDLGSEFQILLIAQCDAPPTSTIDLELFHLPDVGGNCTDTCAVPLACAQGVTFVHCPGCVRHGSDKLKFTASRVNLGEPDNESGGGNGVDDRTGNTLLNIAPDEKKTVMVGDTLQIVLSSSVLELDFPQPPPSGFGFGYYEIGMPSNCFAHLTPLDADVRIYDADGGSGGDTTYTFTIDSGAAVMHTNDGYRYDFSVHVLHQDTANVPLTFQQFEFGDSVTVMPRFKLTGNISAIKRLCSPIFNHIYMGLDTLPQFDPINSCKPDTIFDQMGNVVLDSIGDTLIAVILSNGDTVPQCNEKVQYFCENVGGQFILNGYNYGTGASLSTSNCAQGFTLSNSISIGLKPGINRFPSEYRTWGFTDTARVHVPLVFGVDSVTISQARTEGTSGFAIQKVHKIVADSASTTGSDTVMYFYLEQYFTSDTSMAQDNDSLLYYADDDHGFSATAFFHPTCQTPTGDYQLSGALSYQPFFDPESGANFDRPESRILMYKMPSFDRQADLTEVDGVSREACWSFGLRTFQGQAFNTWLLPDTTSVSGIMISEITVDGGSPLLSQNGFYQVGTVAGSSQKMKICGEYICIDSIPSDSIKIYLGWNCPNYPTSLADYPCPPDSFYLTLTPRSAELQDSVITPETIAICDSVPVQVFVSSTGVGNMFDLTIKSVIPTGMALIPGSDSLEYPRGSGTMLAADVSGALQQNGDTLIWKVDSIHSFLKNSGLPGVGFFPLFSSSSADSTNLVLSFYLESSCDLSPNNSLFVSTSGVTNCNTLKTPEESEIIYEIENYPIATQKALSINMSDFTTCDSTAIVTVSITNDDVDSTGVDDLFNFVLPPCVEYNYGGTFIDIVNGPFPQIPDSNGSVLTWHFQSGVSPGDSIVFSFEVSVADSSCGTGLYDFEGITTSRDTLHCAITDTVCELDVFAGSMTVSSSLNQPLAITSVVNNVSCTGFCDGDATINVTGGAAPYTYLWPNGDTTAAVDSLCPDTIILVITDSSNCSVTDTLAITETEVLTSFILNSQGASCDSINGICDGAAVDSVTGGTPPYLYSWSSGEVDSIADSLCSGSQHIIVTDDNGCIDTTLMTISSPAPITITITNIIPANCFDSCDGSATVTVIGGTTPYNLLWDDTLAQTTLTADSLCAGNDTIMVTDSSGCVASKGVSITQPVGLTTSMVSDTVSCNGGNDGAANLTVSGGIPPYAYVWSTGDTSEDISGLVAGTYIVDVTDSNGCTTASSVTIEESDTLSLIVLTLVNVSCNGGNDGVIDVSVSGGIAPYSFLWSNGVTSQTLTNIIAGSYTLTVTDNEGCVFVDSITITEPTAPLNLVLSTTDLACNGVCTGTASVASSGGVAPYTYQWFSNGLPEDTTQSIGNLCAGPIKVLVADANGCSDSINSVINQSLPLIAIITDSSDVACNTAVFNAQDNGSASVSASGGVQPYTFQWTNSSSTDSIVDDLPVGLQNVLVTDVNGCSISANVTINEPPVLLIDSVDILNATCNDANGQITIFASGGTPSYLYRRLPDVVTPQSSPVFTNVSAGTYIIQVIDNNNCIVRDTVFVGPPTLGVSVATIVAPSTCISTDGQLQAQPSGGTPPYSYQWSSNALSQTTQTAVGLSFGLPYAVTVTDQLGCTASDNESLSSAIQLSFTVTPTVCNGLDATGTITATPSGGLAPFSYQWDDPNSQTNSVATGLAAGIYTVTVTDNLGCAVNDTASVSSPVIAFDFINPVITSDTIWTDPLIRVKGTLKIVQGVTLTIVSSTVEFSFDAGHARAIAQGKLKLINSTLKGPGDCIWEGVSLGWLQFGFIEMISSTIQNAVIGISDNRWPQFTEANLQPQSGLITAINSNFANNKRAVSIGININGSFVNTSVFKRCDFEYNDSSPFVYGSGEEMQFVTLSYAKDLVFRGNHFKNATPNSFNINERGVAIQAYTTDFTVERTCNITDNQGNCLGQRNKFEGLTYGIRANGVISFSTLRVEGCEFTNTQKGIYLGNFWGAKLNKNIFDMPVSQTTFPYGIYLDGSTGYEVEENEFFTASSQTLTIGILANNSGSSGDELYNNAFHDLGIGIQTQGDPGFNSNQGLQIKCNDFVSNVNFFDILVVSGDIENPQGRCLDEQQFPNLFRKAPAGNTFSHTCNSATSDVFANNNTFFRYNHHNDALRAPQANCFSDIEVEDINCQINFNADSACASNFTITGNPCGFGPGPCGPVIIKLKGKTVELRTAFDSLLDGGNTAGLLATVATQSSGQVKNALMAAAPYVSDTVLLAYLNKPTKGKGHVAPGHVKEVIVANSPVTGTVKVATDNRNLPPGIQNQIDAAQVGVSPRGELELEIAFFEGQLSLELNSLSRYFLHDSLTVDGVDSVIEILETQSGINRKLQLTEAYIEAERLTEAKLQLGILDLKGGFANFCKINNIIIDILEDSAAFDTLIADTTLKLTVEDIASDTLEHGYLQARAILSIVFGTRFPEYIEPLPQQIQLKTSGNSEGGTFEETADLILSEEIQDLDQWVKVYPNPADRSVTIDYLFLDGTSNAELCVYDIFGTKVYQQLILQQRGAIQHDVSGLPQGIYLYTITTNQAVISREKIMVIR